MAGRVMLSVIDQHWREHLTEMDYLREGINLRAMGQRDPLAEWQKEGFDLFAEMMNALTVDYVRYLMHVEGTPPPRRDDDGGPGPPARPRAAGAPADGTDGGDGLAAPGSNGGGNGS